MGEMGPDIGTAGAAHLAPANVAPPEPNTLRNACSPFAVNSTTRESLARFAHPSATTRASSAAPSAPAK